MSGKQLKLDKVLLAVEKGAPPSYAPFGQRRALHSLKLE